MGRPRDPGSPGSGCGRSSIDSRLGRSESPRTFDVPDREDALQLPEHGLLASGDGAHAEEATGRLGDLPGAAQEVFAELELALDAEPCAERGDEVSPGLDRRTLRALLQGYRLPRFEWQASFN